METALHVVGFASLAVGEVLASVLPWSLAILFVQPRKHGLLYNLLNLEDFVTIILTLMAETLKTPF